MFRKSALGFISLALLFLALVLGYLLTAGFSHAHGAVSAKRPNSIGVEEFYSNPNVYMFGSVADATIIEGDHDDMYTNIRFQPYNTMSLYDETVLFCGNDMAAFEGHRRPLLVTYRRQATKTFRGIACHDLTSVFEVSAK